MLGGSDGVSAQVDSGLLASLENVVMSGPLRRSVHDQFATRQEERTHPVEITDTEVLGSHDGRKDTSRVGGLVGSDPSGLSSVRLLLSHISFLPFAKEEWSAYDVGGIGLIITADEDAIVEVTLTMLSMPVSVIPVVLLGIGVWVLRGISAGLID